MEKIVVLTGSTDKDVNLINCLKMLFPECYIEVHTKGSETENNENSSIDYPGNNSNDDTLNKFMSFL